MVSLLFRRLLDCKTPSIYPLHISRPWSTVVYARKRSPVSEGLSTVLKDELKVEKERYRTPDAVLDGPPSAYELEDRPNSNVLLLSRSFGGEEVIVEIDLDNQVGETPPTAAHRAGTALQHNARCLQQIIAYKPHFSALCQQSPGCGE